MKRIILFIAIHFAIFSGLFAWTYPEHRRITLLAINQLNNAYRTELDSLWAMARKGYENRLDAIPADLSLGLKPAYIDYAAWPSISADHSGSPMEMVEVILKTKWIMKVANAGAILEVGLQKAKNRSERINKLTDSDIMLMRADPHYVSRADANRAHFMLALTEEDNNAEEYFSDCIKEGVVLNLLGTYEWYHSRALLKARLLASVNLTGEERSQISLAALADEAFALHFLEDGFSSGHVAGIWGDASQRKGTHDYYNEKGLAVTTWRGTRTVLIGDAFLQPENAARIAVIISLSLRQFLDAAQGKLHITEFAQNPSKVSPDTFNLSRTIYTPYCNMDSILKKELDSVLIDTPVPGLATGIGELPRFRSEIGPFIGIAPAARLGLLKHGFGKTQNLPGAMPGLELGVRFGFSLKGVLNESSDGLVFFDAGGRLDGASTMEFDKNPTLYQFGSVYSAIPGRDAYYFRIHMPFFLIPGDLLLLSPVLLILSPATLEKIAMTAANGGLIPWQSVINTPVGSFQFVLGREIGLSLFGNDRHKDAFMMPAPTIPGNQELISMTSTQIDFPILEYRLMRTFSSQQSASLILQFNAGLDLPDDVKVTYPSTAPTPVLRNIWFIGFRLAFDWRYYFSKKK